MDNQIKLLSDLLGQSEFIVVDHYLSLLAKNNSAEQRVQNLKVKLNKLEKLFNDEKKQYLQERELLKKGILYKEKQLSDESKVPTDVGDVNKDDSCSLIRAPLFPDTISDGILYTWYFDIDECIAKDDVICEIEIDKAILEIVAPEDGFIKKIIKSEGDAVYSYEELGVFTCVKDASIETDSDDSKAVWVDPETDLMWSRICIGQEWKKGQCYGHGDQFMIQDAINICENFRLANFDDWRLPSKKELMLCRCLITLENYVKFIKISYSIRD
ncbi:biotin/lipoyl-containing protein [Acinetobacter sp.]|uniref:biotin/lipoyl-containing protein n=1 Tax=Acinetobacter sp. TaxID=472 RepID=UPI0038904E32